MKKIRIFFNGISWLLTVIVCLTVVFLVLSVILGIRLFCVQTGSMEPEVPVGSLIYVVPVEFESLSENDIITYYANGVVVTHRVIGIDSEKKLLATKGDNNNVADPGSVAYENIIGRVSFSIKYAGYPILFLETKSGRWFILGVAVVLFILNKVINYLCNKSHKTT